MQDTTSKSSIRARVRLELEFDNKDELNVFGSFEERRADEFIRKMNSYGAVNWDLHFKKKTKGNFFIVCFSTTANSDKEQLSAMFISFVVNHI